MRGLPLVAASPTVHGRTSQEPVCLECFLPCLESVHVWKAHRVIQLPDYVSMFYQAAVRENRRALAHAVRSPWVQTVHFLTS